METTRLEDESPQAYAAWRLYAEMGPQRSQDKVRKKLKVNRALIGRWSAKYDWKKRLVTWDLEAAQRRENAEAQVELENARARAKRQEEVQDGAWEMFKELRAKAKEMLAFPVGKKTVKEGEHTTIIEPVRWRFSDLAKLVSVADSLGRLATGMATSKSELTGPDGGPLPAASPTEILVTVESGNGGADIPAEKIIHLRRNAAA